MRFFGLFGGKRKSRVEAVPHVMEQVVANNGEIVGALLGIAAEMADDIARRLPTEQDTWWFLAEQYARTVDLVGFHLQLLETSSLKMHEIEYEGRRSQKLLCRKAKSRRDLSRPESYRLSSKLPGSLVDTAITQAFILFVEQNMPTLNALRIKCAAHFHNNCIAMVHTTTPNDGRT